MRRFYCDKCKQLVKDPGSYQGFELKFYDAYSPYETRQYDLCLECRDAVFAFIEGTNTIKK